jgi:hypothetical protein
VTPLALNKAEDDIERLFDTYVALGMFRAIVVRGWVSMSRCDVLAAFIAPVVPRSTYEPH